MIMRKFFPVLPVFLLLAACDAAGLRLNETAPPPPNASESGGNSSVLVLQPAYFEVVGTQVTRTMHLLSWSGSGDDGGFQDHETASSVTWSVDDPAVAIIDADGNLRTLGVGETFIRASEGDQEAVAHVTVVAALEPATEPPPTPSIPDGDPTAPPSAEVCSPVSSNAFAARVISHRTGTGGGFQEEKLPGIVLSGPRGEGTYQGGYDTYSLGVGGEIVLELAQTVCDGSGPDFTVFENAFRVGTFGVFVEPGLVSVSEDGMTFKDFPCALTPPYAGCAGLQPVLANVEFNDINPLDPEVSGGDAFDLATIGITKARFIRVRDSNLALGPLGPGTDGFDLDAVSILNGIKN